MDTFSDLDNVLTLEEDMARFPDKTEEEVNLARRLWNVGTIALKPAEYATPQYVLRVAIVRASSRLHTLLLTARSWPMLLYDRIFKGESIASHTRFQFAMDAYISYLYCNEVKAGFVVHTEHMALIGELLGDRTFFLESLKLCVSDEKGLDFEQCLVFVSQHSAVQKAKNLEEIQRVYAKSGLLRFLIDKYTWERQFIRARKTSCVLTPHLEQFLQNLLVEERAIANPVAPFEFPRNQTYLKEISRDCNDFKREPSVGFMLEAGDMEINSSGQFEVGHGNTVSLAAGYVKTINKPAMQKEVDSTGLVEELPSHFEAVPEQASKSMKVEEFSTNIKKDESSLVKMELKRELEDDEFQFLRQKRTKKWTGLNSEPVDLK